MITDLKKLTNTESFDKIGDQKADAHALSLLPFLKELKFGIIGIWVRK